MDFLPINKFRNSENLHIHSSNIYDMIKSGRMTVSVSGSNPFDVTCQFGTFDQMKSNFANGGLLLVTSSSNPIRYTILNLYMLDVSGASYTFQIVGQLHNGASGDCTIECTTNGFKIHYTGYGSLSIDRIMVIR